MSCGAASAQTNDLSATNSVSPATNSVASSENSTNVANLGNVTVVGQLDQARSQILPNLGATAYTHTAEQIQSQSQGDNAPFNQVILRSPGVAQDSAANGDLHVRGEHANLQYRIDDVLLPEGITGFGLELDPRFVDSMQLITGSLPAQYGFRTAGVVDIQTKSGDLKTAAKWLCMAAVTTPSVRVLNTAARRENAITSWTAATITTASALKIRRPATTRFTTTRINTRPSFMPRYILSDTSRMTIMGSASYSNFQIPNTPGLPVGTAPGRRHRGIRQAAVAGEF